MNFVLLADRPDAVSIVAAWYFQQWGHRRPGASLESTCARLQRSLNRDRIPLIVLAIEDDTVVGAAELKHHEMELYQDRAHWLGGVFVASTHRGKGVASRLVERVVEMAASLSVEELHLQTEKLDGGLYARLGWKACEQVWYKGREVLVMKRRLGG